MANAIQDLAGWWTRNSPEYLKALAESRARAANSEGYSQIDDPFAPGVAGNWQGGSNVLANAGALDYAYNPQTQEAVGTDAQGNPLWDSRFSTKANEDPFWIGSLLAGGLVGAAAGGALGGAGGYVSPEIGGMAAQTGLEGAAGGAAGAGLGSYVSPEIGGMAAQTGLGGAGATGGVAAGGSAGSAGIGSAGMGSAGGGMDWTQFASSLVGPALQSVGANEASKAYAGSTQAGIDEQRRQFDLTRGDFAPYREAGVRGLSQYEQGIGQMPTAAEVMAQPGYQFGLDQGQQAIQRRIAASGGRISGPAIKAAARFGTDYATSGYNAEYQRRQDRLNRLAALAGIGQSATGSSAAAGQNSANAITGLISNQGDAMAQGRVAQGNIWGNAANQLAAMYGRKNRPNDINPQYGLPNYAIDPYSGGG